MHSPIRVGYLNNSEVSLPEKVTQPPTRPSQLPLPATHPHHLPKARPAACTILGANQQPLKGKPVSEHTRGGEGRAGQDETGCLLRAETQNARGPGYSHLSFRALLLPSFGGPQLTRAQGHYVENPQSEFYKHLAVSPVTSPHPHPHPMSLLR